MTVELTLVGPEPALAADVIKALEGARDRVAAGWCQRQGYCVRDGQQRYCLVAALAVSSPSTQIFEASLLAVRSELPWGYTSASAYNDRAQTAQRDVVELLGRAIQVTRKAAA